LKIENLFMIQNSSLRLLRRSAPRNDTIEEEIASCPEASGLAMTKPNKGLLRRFAPRNDITFDF